MDILYSSFNSRCHQFHDLLLIVPLLLYYLISTSPQQLHIRLQATLAKAHKHHLVLQGIDVLQPHFTIFKISSGAAVMLSGKPEGASTLHSSSLLEPYRVGSNARKSASLVAYHTMACKCTLLTFSLKDSSAVGKDCKGGVAFLALDIFVWYQGIIRHLVIDSCWNP